MTGPPAGVVLSWDLWCGRHLVPYRARWPEGTAVAMIRLFEAALKMDAVIAWTGGDADQITAALQRFRPLCCFIPNKALQAIYAETVPSAAPN